MKWWDMVHACMVRTECTMVAAVSDGTSHVTTKQCCKYTTLVAIQNALWKATVVHLKSHNTTAQWVYLKAENGHHINATNNNNISVINSKCMDIWKLRWQIFTAMNMSSFELTFALRDHTTYINNHTNCCGLFLLTALFYWAILAGLLTLDFCPALHKSLGCFYFRCVLLHNGRRWQWICEFYTDNFKDIFGGL